MLHKNGSSVGSTVILTMLWAAVASAQISQASLQGTVKDATGAVVPGATVTLKQTGTGSTRSATSGAAGEYSLSNLDPAEYSLTIAIQGFKTLVISSLILHTGEHATVDGALEVGAATQEVTVGASVPLLETSSAEVSHLVPPSQVLQLPLNGRNFWELTQLTPGATFIPRAQTAQYNGSEIRARNVNVTVNGQSYIFTGWSLDGANVTNFELGGTLIQPNVDAIQEFAVGAGNMSPEFGHSPNMINASLKSGSNAFHGSLFEFLRNDDLDARNFFLANKIPLKRNQFGGTIGGPVWRDKIFFFADYQGTRLHQGTAFSDIVPSVAERQGNFSQLLPKAITDPLTGAPFPGNIIPANRVASQATTLLQYLPLPNTVQGGTSRDVFSTGTPINQDEADLRLDAHATDKDLIMARYSIANNNEFNPNPFPALMGTNLHSSAQDTTARWTHIFGPRVLNVAQASYYNSPFLFGVVLPGFDETAAGILGFSDPVITPVKSFPNINLSGYQAYQGSPSDQRPKNIIIHTWQFQDAVTYNLGKHELKFGAEWMYRRDAFSIGQNSNGNFSFVGTYTGDAFGDFLLGYPDNATRSPFQTLQGDHDNFKALYVNDNFHVRPGLTINVGLRYESNPFFKGILDTRSGFDFQAGKIIVPTGVPANAQPLTPQLLQLFGDRIEYTGQLGLPESVSPPANDFAPRFGVAWNPAGLPHTVVRAGYGIFYTFPDTNLFNNTVVTVPFVDNITLFNDRPPAVPTRTIGDFFQGTPIALANPNPGQPCPFGFVANSCDTPGITSALAHLKQQYTQQWNLTVQQQLATRVSLTAAYVGSGTLHLQQGIRRNDPPPAPGAIQSRRPFPQWGPIGLQEWGGKGNYNALQTEVEIRDWHGLTLMGSYVYSKCLDNGTDESSAPATQLIGLNYAVCDFDQRNTATASFNYALPFGKGKQFGGNMNPIVNGILGGWQLAGVNTFKSGLPFTPTITNDRANTGVGSQRPQLVGTPQVQRNVGCWFYTSSNSTCVSQFHGTADAFAVPAIYTYGNSGRNILRGDNLNQFDFTAMKDFPFSETRRLEFRAEFFNLFNHAVFALPGGSINSSSGGQVSSTLNSNRIIEFAMKLYF